MVDVEARIQRLPLKCGFLARSGLRERRAPARSCDGVKID